MPLCPFGYLSNETEPFSDGRLSRDNDISGEHRPVVVSRRSLKEKITNCIVSICVCMFWRREWCALWTVHEWSGDLDFFFVKVWESFSFAEVNYPRLWARFLAQRGLARVLVYTAMTNGRVMGSSVNDGTRAKAETFCTHTNYGPSVLGLVKALIDRKLEWIQTISVKGGVQLFWNN